MDKNFESMEKTFEPDLIEQRTYSRWESSGYFKATGKGEPFCIMIPPPNVTGTLHMGHGFQNTLMDVIIRYQRMMGRDTHWQVGTDHAGIATQMVVERQLQQKGISRHDLGREAFLEKVWEWKAESGSTITKQLRRLGCSMDWDSERFTMDEGLSHSVQQVFIRLYNEGLIYRGKRLVNWDPTLLTAISDLEVEFHEEEGYLWHLRYPLKDSECSGKNYIVVATTRPETMLGDVAVAVHPDDERYQHLIGNMIVLPLTQREIPIIADDYVDPTFGSGCVKITPAHDTNDYAMGRRHDLPMINIFTPDAKINKDAPQQYQGLDRYDARKKMVADLESLSLVEKIQPHTLNVPRGDRSGVVIEPYLTDQWFVKMDALAKPALDVVRRGKLTFTPETYTKTYNQWLENIEDWCISRQLWWGHRIPAWYDHEGNIYVGETESEVRAKHNLSADIVLTQDNDVLDTWFSSALWPFSTLGWPKQTAELARYYPTNVLVTGFDIIFFWVARMIMMGMKFTGNIPFHTVYIHGLIRDSEGQKMSKTKGNVLDPLDIIDGISLENLLEKRTSGMMQPQLAKKIIAQTQKDFPEGIGKHGTDPLRFTYCALASTGRDIRFDMSRLDGYRNFCNKIWNAARYVLMNTQDEALRDSGEVLEFSLADRWIQSRLQHVIQHAHQHINEYRFDLLAKSLYEFVWNEYCDWYLELSKPILYGSSSSAQKRGTRHNLLSVLEILLRLLHPIMPFVTEEIWLRVAPLLGIDGESIMIQPYPHFHHDAIDHDVEADITWLQNVIVTIRTIRSEMNISPSRLVPIILHKGSHQDKERLHHTTHLLMNLAKVESIAWHDSNTPMPLCATGLCGEMEILIPMAGLIDVKAECERLEKEILKLEKEITRAEVKLSNPGFTDRAPAAVVEKERLELAENKSAIQKLEIRKAQMLAS